MNDIQWRLALREIAKLDILKMGKMSIISEFESIEAIRIDIFLSNPIDMKDDDIKDMFRALEDIVKLGEVKISGQSYNDVVKIELG